MNARAAVAAFGSVLLAGACTSPHQLSPPLAGGRVTPVTEVPPHHSDSLARMWVEDGGYASRPQPLIAGQTIRLVARIVSDVPSDGYGADFEVPARLRLRWNSLTPDIASVDSLGRVMAIDTGEARLVAELHLASAVGDDAPMSEDTVFISVLPPDSALARLRPEAVAARAGAVGGFTCALDGDGDVICLTKATAGFERHSRDGGPTIHSYRHPGGKRFTSVTVGERSVCALADDATAYCWGDGVTGAVGDGSFERRSVPTAVHGSHRWRTLVAGPEVNCGVTAEGETKCWGMDMTRVLFPDTLQVCASFRERYPVQPALVLPRCVNTPQRVELPTPAIDLAVGQGYACALGRGGELYCMGVMYRPSFQQASPVRMKPENVRLERLSGGREHICGLDASGAAYCWGRNWEGQLGQDSLKDGSRQLLRVEGLPPLQTISAGAEHTCAVARDGRAFCWGKDTDGRLGHGAVTYDPALPAPVTGSLAWSDVAAGGYHSCGITRDKVLYCWGSSSHFPFAPLAIRKHREPVRIGGW